MKTIAMIAAVAAMVAGIGAASAQDVSAAGPNFVGRTFESVVPFGRNADGNDGLLSGRSAYVGSTSTDHVYGNGPDGQGVTAPFINGIF